MHWLVFPKFSLFHPNFLHTLHREMLCRGVAGHLWLDVSHLIRVSSTNEERVLSSSCKELWPNPLLELSPNHFGHFPWFSLLMLELERGRRGEVGNNVLLSNRIIGSTRRNGVTCCKTTTKIIVNRAG